MELKQSGEQFSTRDIFLIVKENGKWKISHHVNPSERFVRISEVVKFLKEQDGED